MASGAMAVDERPTLQDTVRDLVSSPAERSDPRVRLAFYALGALFVLGIIGLIGRFVDGTDDRSKWGYYAAVVSFLLTTAGAAPMVSIAPAIAKANWVRHVSRVSQLFSVVGILTALMQIPLIVILPPLVEDGIRRRSIWFGSPTYAPHFWDMLAITGLVFIGLGLLWANAVPDLAAIRETGTGWRQRWARRLAPGFVGTTQQWKALRARMGMLGTIYFVFLIFTHLLFASDFAIALVAGWKDAIFPMYHALTSLQAGVASTIVAAYFVRKWGKLERYLDINQFWPMAKLQFALSLMWFYFFFSSFIVFWYGRSSIDSKVINLLVNGPYWWAFLGAFILCFLVPMWTLMFNKIRVSIKGPTIIAGAILIGTLLDRIRIYAAAWSTKDMNDKILAEIPSTVWPDVFDIFIIIGAIAGAALLFLAATRFIPAVSLWEVHQSRLLSRPTRFGRGNVVLVGKPD